MKRAPLATRTEAVACYERGDKVEEIAEAAGVGLKALYRWVRALGVPLRERGGAHVTAALRGNKRNAIPEYLVPMIVERYARGESAEKVGTEIGVAHSTVLRVARRAGVVVRPSSYSGRGPYKKRGLPA